MTNALHILLGATAERGASDLHLSPGEMPWLRIQGEMTPLPLETGPLGGAEIEGMLHAVMAPEDLGRWNGAERRSVNFAYAAPEIGRFRVSLASSLAGSAAVIRRIPPEVPSTEGLGLPAAATDLADAPAGLVFVTGASGAGKSTTLAALVDRINQTRNGHILTIEDPVEYVHTAKRCRVTQREVGIHTASFTDALEDALRQDPDVIVVGEVRTAAQLQLILQAAETGHLVMGSLHTITAVNAISRMVGMVETARQGQVRAQIAESLRGIITQRLVPAVDGERVAALEILVNSAAVAANIETGNTVEIRSAIESGRAGMRTLEQSLAGLVVSGHVSYAVAREHANDPKALDRHLGTGAGDSTYR